MSEDIKVKVLKGFLDGRTFVDVGETIAADPERARALARNGLVELPGGEKVAKDAPRDMTLGGEKPAAERQEKIVEEKKAAPPKNKKATEPKNKSR